MKFTIEKDIFAETVSWVTKLLPDKTPNEILSGVKIEAKDDGNIEFSIYDYTISAKTQISANVVEAGSTVVPAHRLSRIATAFSNKPITFEINDNNALIYSEKVKFILPTMSADEYPQLPKTEKNFATIDSSLLYDSVRQVAFATAKEEIPVSLASIYCEIFGDDLRLAATDRFRLAYRELKWTLADSPEEKKISFLLNSKLFQDIVGLLKDSTNVAIGFTFNDAKGDSAERKANMLSFSSKNREITIQAVGGEYVPIERLLSQQYSKELVLDLNTLKEAVKRVSLVETKNPVVYFELDTKKNLSLICGKNTDSQAEEIIENVKTDISELVCAFNCAFLREGLNAIEEPFVKFRFNISDEEKNTNGKPVEIAGQQELNGEQSHYYKYILVPLGSQK